MLWCLPQIAMCTRPPSYLRQMSSGMQAKVWFGYNPTSCPRVSFPQSQCIDLIFKLMMVIQVGHTHKLILHLYLPNSLVIAQAMGMMFLPKVKMNILAPKLMFGFWWGTFMIMMIIILNLPWGMKVLTVVTVVVSMAITQILC